MPSTVSLLRVLTDAFPEFTFAKGIDFHWSHTDKTVTFSSLKTPQEQALVLHEIAHGVLRHAGYTSDIDLIQKEVAAWELTKEDIAPRFSLSIDETIIQDTLDTYRDWLHKRSICPSCKQNGVQTKNDTYQCINCQCRWRVNEARNCQLKRYTY